MAPPSALNETHGDTGPPRPGHRLSTRRTGTLDRHGTAIGSQRDVRGHWTAKAGPSALNETYGDIGPPWSGPTPRHHEVAHGRVLSHLPGPDTPVIVARDAKTGRELWKRSVPNAGRASGFYGFAASPKRIYVLGSGRVEVLEADTGALIGTVR